MATTPTKAPTRRAAPKRKATAPEAQSASATEAAPEPEPEPVPAKRRTSKPKAETKPAVAPKPRARRRSPAVRVTAIPKAADAALKKARSTVAAIPLPEVTPRRVAVVAASTGGVLAALGAAFFLWRASKADQPNYRVTESEGDFEIREYPALVVASTETHGPREAALNRGFDILADYIFAKSRPGPKISMTAPVLSDGTNTTRWRTRFIMPAGQARADLPSAPSGITLESEAPRRVAVVRFSGRARDSLLDEKEGALRSWLQLRKLPSEAKAEHAFYNSPMMPGPLRRNEVIVPLSTR